MRQKRHIDQTHPVPRSKRRRFNLYINKPHEPIDTRCPSDKTSHHKQQQHQNQTISKRQQLSPEHAQLPNCRSQRLKLRHRRLTPNALHLMHRLLSLTQRQHIFIHHQMHRMQDQPTHIFVDTVRIGMLQTIPFYSSLTILSNNENECFGESSFDTKNKLFGGI